VIREVHFWSVIKATPDWAHKTVQFKLLTFNITTIFWDASFKPRLLLAENILQLLLTCSTKEYGFDEYAAVLTQPQKK